MSNEIPFRFLTRLNLVRLLGVKAHNPRELLEGLKVVPASSIYYHTHRYIEQHNYLSPEPPNDFAYWLTHILQLRELGELIASVDIIRFKHMEELRGEFMRILASHAEKSRPMAYCQEGQEFHFMSCVTFVLPTPYEVRNLTEFAEALSKISINSLYYHIFEAPKRLEADENDFTAWFNALGAVELAGELAHLDPYTHTLEGLREKIIGVVKRYAHN